jgi:hypothetical protein
MKKFLSCLILLGLFSLDCMAQSCCKCTVINTLPYRIDTPGVYCVSGNLTGASGSAGISVTVSDVTIDLCGFTLTGVSGSFDGIEVSSGLSNITITNGTLRNWDGAGVNALVEKVRLDRVNACENGGDGIRAGAYSIITQCRAIDNGVRGILAMQGSTIDNCIVKGSSGHALQTGGGSCEIFNSICESNLGNGFFSNVSGNNFVNCTAVNNGLTGFTVGSGGTMRGCSAVGNGSDGIRGDGRSTIVDTTANGNGANGIQVYDQSTVRGCTVTANQDAGILANGPRNRIEANHATDNTRGIDVDSTQNAVVKNSACGNTTTNYDIAAGNQVGPLTFDPAVAVPWANLDCNDSKAQ